MSRLSLLLAIVALVISFRDSRAEDPGPGRQVAQVFQPPKSPDSELGYWLYLPEDYGKGSQKSPLLLFLHGSGERGSDLSLVKKHGPPKLLGQGRQMPFVVVSPQCPDRQQWKTEHLLALLDSLCGKYSIDTSRIYVTGLSMGGVGTWALVAAEPHRFAAAVPICGHADPWMVSAASTLPVWIVVGDRDSQRLVGNCFGMADSLQAWGADVKLTVMHGVGHDSWTETYASPELYEWMLRHRRTD